MSQLRQESEQGLEGTASSAIDLRSRAGHMTWVESAVASVYEESSAFLFTYLVDADAGAVFDHEDLAASKSLVIG